MDKKSDNVKYWFYTITLSPSIYNETLKAQYMRSSGKLVDCLSPVLATVVAEKTDNFNLHYHAIIKMSEQLRYKITKRLFALVNNNKKIFGHVFHKYEITTNEKMEELKEYIKKGQIDSETYGYDNVVIDNLDIFNFFLEADLPLCGC